MAEHRASVLSASLRRYPDPERSGDPRISALLSDLRALEVTPLPRAHFRAELRAQLVAVAPRLVAEGTAVEVPRAPAAGPQRAPAKAPPPRSGALLARLHNISLGRTAVVATALVAIFAMLLGSAVYISKRALPGDALYSLKRANETVQLSLADGATAKSRAYLDFASERADEVLALLKRSSALAGAPGPSAAGSVSARTASLVSTTLDSADADARNAAQLLGSQAVNSSSASSLAMMTQWAPGQISKLQAIAAQLPAGSLHDRATASAQLVMSAQSRASQLTGLAGCTCLRSAPTDELGPQPCQPCDSTAIAPRPTVSAVTPAPASLLPGPGTNSSSAAPAPTGVPPRTPAPLIPSGAASPTGASPGATLPPVPTLPIHLPTLPTITFPSHPPTGASPNHSCVISLLGLCI
ncbi:MAG: DUF5667 domain-containing protein [Actinomycetota bacterium]|nr:DUF5667 domain-containing protein [Actinomycetota bacterium]